MYSLFSIFSSTLFFTYLYFLQLIACPEGVVGLVIFNTHVILYVVYQPQSSKQWYRLVGIQRILFPQKTKFILNREYHRIRLKKFREALPRWNSFWIYYSDVIMGTMASQITNLTIVYSAVYSGADEENIRVTGLCAGNSPVTSNAENISIEWRHHELITPML